MTRGHDKQKRYDKQYSRYIENKDSALDFGKLMRTAALGAAILLTPTVSNETSISDFQLSALVRLRIEEGFQVSKALIKIEQRYSSPDKTYITPLFLAQVMTEAQWASQQLGIPRAFIVSQWLMETGRLNEQSGASYAIKNNNLGGIKEGEKDKCFKDLHDFAEAYVKILKKDGIQNTVRFWDMAYGLHQSHYVVGMSTMDYGNHMLDVLKDLNKVSPEFSDYYEKCTVERSLLKPDKLALYNVE